MEIKPTIVDFYSGRSVFVTGATGFMGKVLVEKLLRSCTGIERIYILLRPVKGKGVAIRLEEFVNNQIFDNVKKYQPKVMEKVVAVAGDVTQPGFGLSSSDLQLLIDNVSIVFNSAATVKFDEELRAAISMNVRGPKELLEISRKMKNLEAFVHVSTAFNNLDQTEMKEEVYPLKTDPVKLMQLLDCLDEETLRSVTDQLVGSCPNTYTYTKALAEFLLWKECGTVPLAIVRPSIVTAALKEPIPGWVDNINGPTGSLSAVGKGFVRVLKVNENMVSDIIPVDYPINLMIAVAWYTAVYRPNEVAVYSCTTGQRNPLTWGMLKERVLESWLKYPPKELLWYPSSYFTTNGLSLKISTFVFHQIPAYFMDFLYYITGKRIKWVRMYEKIQRAFSCLEFFTTHQWRFISNNPTRLMELMSAEDRETFYFDVRNINWKSYFETYILGARKFILKDDITTLESARKNLLRLYWLRTLIRVFIFSFSILGVTAVKNTLSSYVFLKKRFV